MPEKPSTAKSKKRMSQLLQLGSDPCRVSRLDFTHLVLRWCPGGCLALVGGQDLAQNSTDSEALSLGLDSPFPPAQGSVPSQGSISPQQTPSTTTAQKQLFYKSGAMASLAIVPALSHSGVFVLAVVPPERAASLVVPAGWHSRTLTGIRDVKEPGAQDPQQPLREHCKH